MTAKLSPTARKARNGRIAALTVFGAGAAASLAANIMAANPTAIGWIVGGFPALMLLGSLYLLENGATHPKWIRWAIVPVIAIAAWMSYWHVVEIVLEAGESPLSAHLFPLIIDLPMAIASAALRPKVATRPVARKRPAVKKTNATSPAKLKVAS
jgi:hypothetical protein